MQNEQDHTSQHLNNRATTAEAIRRFHIDDMEADFARTAARVDRNADLLDDPANYHLFFTATPLLRREDEMAMALALQERLRARAQALRGIAFTDTTAYPAPSETPAPASAPAPIELTETGKSVAEKLSEIGRKISAIKAKAKRRSETARAAANARWAAERKHVLKTIRKPAAKKPATKKPAVKKSAARKPAGKTLRRSRAR